MCVVCGQDCSARPRVKDQHGRYTCKACMGAEAGAPAPRPARTSPSPGAGDDAYVLLDLERPEGGTLGQSPSQPCPACGTMLAAGAALCTNCGRAVESGKRATTSVGAPIEASTYSADPRKAKRQREREKEDARAVRNQYLVPIVLTVAGTGAYAAISGARDQADVAYIAAYFVGMGVVSTAFYLFCCYLWLGLNTALHVVVLQMISVVACTSAASALLSFLQIGGIAGLAAWLVGSAMVCAGLMVKVMDLEFQDAIMAAAISYLVPSFVVGYVVMLILVK